MLNPPATLADIPCITVDSTAVLTWYDRHARSLPWRVSPQDRANGIAPNPYFIWLSEVMLQQTTIAAVIAYFNTFTRLWPTVFDLAQAPLDDVLVQWAGLGYYARARNLHACAQAVVTQHNGVFPVTAEQLRALPGIGDYTSAAIASICHDEQIAVLDGNVDRVMARFLALPVPVRDEKLFIRSRVQQAVPKRAGDFAQAMMDIGATVCAPRRANCLICPLEPECIGTKTGNPLAYPVPAIKAEKPLRFGHAYVMQNPDGSVFLRQRGPKGLLAKMTETPNSEWTSQFDAVEYPVMGDWVLRGEVVHVFTHFRLTLKVWHIETQTALDEGWWADMNALDNEALPSLFRKVLRAASVDN